MRHILRLVWTFTVIYFFLVRINFSFSLKHLAEYKIFRKFKTALFCTSDQRLESYVLLFTHFLFNKSSPDEETSTVNDASMLPEISVFLKWEVLWFAGTLHMWLYAALCQQNKT